MWLLFLDGEKSQFQMFLVHIFNYGVGVRTSYHNKCVFHSYKQTKHVHRSVPYIMKI